MRTVKRRKTCRICESTRLVPYLDLGYIPLVNSYQSPHQQPRPGHELKVLFCKQCGLSQTSCVVHPEDLYSDYAYHSGVSQTFADHCDALAEWIQTYYPGGLCVDIAANDGTLVSAMQRQYLTALGVEPASNLVTEAVTSGIPMLEGFFDYDMACRLKQKARVITALNVVAHIDQLHNFFHHVAIALRPDGVFIFEVPYLAVLTDRLEFDTVYHEHLSYFLVDPLYRALTSARFYIEKIEQLPIHGGSLRITAVRKPRSIEVVHKATDLETRKGLYNPATYKSVQQNVETIKTKLKKWVKGKKVVCFGAAAKGTVLLNACGLTEEDILYVVDDTIDKQGKAIPGTRIPIVSREVLYDDEPPDAILILAWNFADEIVRSLPEHLRSCCYIPYRRDGSGVQAVRGGSGGETAEDDSGIPAVVQVRSGGQH